MRLTRSSTRYRALGTLAVAAGGFAAGGLAMALGLSVADPQAGEARVVLQDDAGPVLSPTFRATLRPAGAATPAPTAAAAVTHRPSVDASAAVVSAKVRTASRATTTRPAPARIVHKPPVVQSTGS